MKEGMYEPPEVSDATEKYRQENDVIFHFYEDNIVKSEGNTLKLKDIYREFQSWYKETYPNTKIPQRPEFKRSFNKAGSCLFSTFLKYSKIPVIPCFKKPFGLNIPIILSAKSRMVYELV